jgi:hypothetical protein
VVGLDEGGPDGGGQVVVEDAAAVAATATTDGDPNQRIAVTSAPASATLVPPCGRVAPAPSGHVRKFCCPNFCLGGAG